MNARDDGRDTFYVGYAGTTDGPLRAFVRRIAVGLVLAGAVLAVGVALSQRRLPPGTFEFGKVRSFEGDLWIDPVPLLRVEGPSGAGSALLVVGPGKTGPPATARALHGRRVRFEGTLARTGGLTVVELTRPGSLEDVGAPRHPGDDTVRTVGAMTVVGELVDTKCWSGVMRPATGKVHRACAVRCLEGGIPPGVRVVGPDGASVVVLLAGADGDPAEVEPQWAALDVEASGVLEIRDGLAVLRAARVTRAAAGSTR